MICINVKKNGDQVLNRLVNELTTSQQRQSVFKIASNSTYKCVRCDHCQRNIGVIIRSTAHISKLSQLKLPQKINQL